MPGLDDSDWIAFLTIAGEPADSVARQSSKIIAGAQAQIDEWEAEIAAATEEERWMKETVHYRSIKRRVEMIARIRSGDPWAFWPYIPNRRLHGIAVFVRYGYWQGFFEDAPGRAPLAKSQWDGAHVSDSIRSFGLPLLRERLAIWSMAHFWIRVGRNFLDGRLPRHMAEVEDIVGDAWWEDNLAGIALGGGIGKDQSEQERILREARAQGVGWQRACRGVYPDPAVAAMIAEYLEGWEADLNGGVVGAGCERMGWPPISMP